MASCQCRACVCDAFTFSVLFNACSCYSGELFGVDFVAAVEALAKSVGGGGGGGGAAEVADVVHPN